jgi:mercuric reductase
MEMQKHNGDTLHLAIIGSGSAAFSCALKVLEQIGDGEVKITMIEGSDIIGGCCVNTGCVPSKILIRAAQLAQQQRDNPFAGLENSEPVLSRALLAQQQSARVAELRQAKYQKMLDSNPKIVLIKGYAQFVDQNTLLINHADGRRTNLNADKIFIATGSSPTVVNIKGLSDTPYWTSTDALFSDKLPQSLVVIGSSVIALELAQAYKRLGSEVTILARHTLLYKEEPLLGETLTKVLQQEGIRILENSQARQIDHDGKNFTISLDEGNIHCEKLLISTGRQPNTQGLQLNNASIKTAGNGAIMVDEQLQTSCKNIYAAGDCSTMPQYVYVAAAAGSRAAINIVGGNAELNLSIMPAVIFTDPQVATVGLTEQQAKNQGFVTMSRVLTMDNVPRALVNFATDGFIKLVAEQSSGKIIGAQILCQDAGELIQSVALAMTNKMTVEQLAQQLFPYLTMVEGLKLCAQTFTKDVTQLSCCAG